MRFDDARLAHLNDNPLYLTLGIRLDSADDGVAQSTLTPQPSVCWPSLGQPHGGVLFTLVDTTMAFAAISTAPDGSGCATVDASIQYPAPARHGPFTCRTEAPARAGRTVFIRAEVRDAQGAVVALAQGSFRIFPPRA